MAKRSPYTRSWIIENGVPIVRANRGKLTVRGLHYQLVGLGMTNDQNHYRAVSGAMTQARWDGLIGFDDLVDESRNTIGETKWEDTDVESELESSQSSIKHWVKNYYKNMWENQPNYVELFIEKQALTYIFRDICNKWRLLLAPCKGYPSLTYIHEASIRFEEAMEAGKKPIMLYFGDHDPSGDDIPESLINNMSRMGVNIELRRVALTKEQVIDMNLPPAPIKSGDARAANWDGLGQVELDAVASVPGRLERLAEDAIKEVFDFDLYRELQRQEVEEREQYRDSMSEFLIGLADELRGTDN